MIASAGAVAGAEIRRWRDMYRLEMACQIIHDSLHARPGWTEAYGLRLGETMVGYGAVAVGGPWAGKPAIFEFFVAPPFRGRVFDLFQALLAASGAPQIDTQSNDPFLCPMLHAFAPTTASESILFHDRLSTSLCVPGATLRPVTADDHDPIKANDLDTDAGWLLEFENTIAATGGVLFHYNRPYGDIYMAVAKGFRRRGLGSYLVQELKRVCYERGDVPAARCNPANLASRKTLQKAGFVPCGHILVGSVAPREPRPA